MLQTNKANVWRNVDKQSNGKLELFEMSETGVISQIVMLRFCCCWIFSLLVTDTHISQVADLF